MRTVLAFGTFDYVHPGHDKFLAQAASLGDRLVVSVARDAHVGMLKAKTPGRTQEERLAWVRNHPKVAEAHLSDEALGTYGLLYAVKPDVIAIGHDQDALADNLTSWMETNKIEIPLVRIERFSRE